MPLFTFACESCLAPLSYSLEEYPAADPRCPKCGTIFSLEIMQKFIAESAANNVALLNAEIKKRHHSNGSEKLGG